MFKKFLRNTSLAAVTYVALTSGASALTITINPDVATGNNNFDTQLTSLGYTNFGTLVGLQLDLGDASIVFTFTEVGAESGFTNTFTVTKNGSQSSITENWGAPVGYLTPNPLTDTSSNNAALDPSISLIASFGDTLGLDFTTSGSLPQGVDATIGDIGMGIFTKTGEKNIFFLAYDDHGGANDDNHDDYLIRVNISNNLGTTITTLPVPAALPLLASGLGFMGLVGWRRRKSAEAAA